MSSKLRPLAGKIALVTGASRGIGKGVALQLSEAGATVYITGRTLKSEPGKHGSLEETAKEIEARGGKCLPIQVDHENDTQIAKLFERISQEQNGRLDILVNNAYKGVETIFNNTSVKFYEQDPKVWDDINNVGLRNHYFCTVYAARMMVPAKQGLIVNISSYGGVRYLFNVAYGVGKAAVDRMMADCGVELKKAKVACISLYPGAVRTELIVDYREKVDQAEGQKEKKSTSAAATSKMFKEGESTEFAGKVIVQMAQDPNIMSMTGKVVYCADYAQKHGLTDPTDNRVILGVRHVKFLAGIYLPENMQFIAKYIPSFVKVPQFLFDITNSKFF